MKALKEILVWLEDFVDLLFPKVCLSCGSPLQHGERYICTACLSDLPKTYFTSTTDNLVYDLLQGRIKNLKNAYSFCFFYKKSNIQKILHAIKYSGVKELAFELGAYLTYDIKETGFKDVDVIIPVPLHPLKQRLRGYNQSEWFARGIAEVLNKPVDVSSVARTVFTETQTKKSKEERWENVKNIFEVKSPAKLEGKHILLFDDVLTTGSTIESLALAIENSVENFEISVLTFATASKIV